MNNLVQLCYIRVLLQEIINGYDTPRYRMRAFIAMLHSGFSGQEAMLWKNKITPTTKMLKQIEERLMDASKQADPAK